MADETYTLPDEPVYQEAIRRLQNTDPVDAEEVLNPLIQSLVGNTEFVRRLAMAIAEQNAADHTAIRRETAQSISEAVSAIPTPDVSGQIGTHNADESAHEARFQALTADDVGAAPAVHSHTADDVGAAPANHTHSATDVGAASATHTHSAADVGAAPAVHTHTAAQVGARPSTWMPSTADVGAVPATRKVNGKALSADITLSAGDVGAAASDHTHSDAATKSYVDSVIGDVTAKTAGRSMAGESVYAESSAAVTAGTGAEIFNDLRARTSTSMTTGNVASGDYAHAEGAGTTASSSCAHAEGKDTKASGSHSHAEGVGTLESATYAPEEGH